jgi:hypothetical protein
LFAGRKLNKHLTQTRSWFQTWQNEFTFASGRRLLALRQADLFDLAIIYEEILSFFRLMKIEIGQIVNITPQLDVLKAKIVAMLSFPYAQSSGSE